MDSALDQNSTQQRAFVRENTTYLTVVLTMNNNITTVYNLIALLISVDVS